MGFVDARVVSITGYLTSFKDGTINAPHNVPFLENTLGVEFVYISLL